MSKTDSNISASAALAFEDWSAGLVFNKDASAFAAPALARRARAEEARSRPARRYRVGVISNPASHRNRESGGNRDIGSGRSGFLAREPQSVAELSEALAEFAEAGVELLVVDGGDGTVRDVITIAGRLFRDGIPPVAIVPSGKTNALALDLGIPGDWTIADAVRTASEERFKTRRPLEILRPGSDEPDLRGFLFGAGAFVRATALAQRTHRAGAFNSFAVGLSLSWAVAQTVFGKKGNPWRAGDEMRIAVDGGPLVRRRLYLLFSSSMETLPLDLKPFGRGSEGLKVLAVDAPPRRMLLSLPGLLAGSRSERLEEAGYHRVFPRSFSASFDSGFILDGELYRGGKITIQQGAPIAFAAP